MLIEKEAGMETQEQAQPINGSVKLGNYLKRLRTGYGYSLRRVEEKARHSGGDIDNSQLSRYEKGICYPSFDKLRVLASVFNVSIQSFSDIIDLESHDADAPVYTDPELALKDGQEELRLGSFGKAYSCFERAIDLIEQERGEAGPDERLGKARLCKAIALHKLNKLSLSEQELRVILRFRSRLSEPVLARVLLQISNIHVELGDAFLGLIEAHQALEMTRGCADREGEAMGFHAIGRIADEEGRSDEAISCFREALRIHEERGNKHEALTLRANLAAQYIALGKAREGTRLMAATIEEARGAGYRRQLAYAYSKLAEAHFKTRQAAEARRYAEESDVVAGAGPVKYMDIL